VSSERLPCERSRGRLPLSCHGIEPTHIATPIAVRRKPSSSPFPLIGAGSVACAEHFAKARVIGPRLCQEIVTLLSTGTTWPVTMRDSSWQGIGRCSQRRPARSGRAGASRQAGSAPGCRRDHEPPNRLRPLAVTVRSAHQVKLVGGIRSRRPPRKRPIMSTRSS
jgi:hypothetical protein